MKKLFGLVLLIAIIAAWQLPQENDQWKDKLSNSLLNKLEAGETVEFLLMMAEQADVSKSRFLHDKTKKGTFVYQKLKEHAAISQKEVIQFLESRSAPVKSFFIVNAVYSTGDFELIRSLAMRADVKKIEYNPWVQADQGFPDHEQNNSREGIEWGIEKIRADEVWELGYTGQNVIVAGADTGVEWDHEAIIQSYKGWSNEGIDHNYNWHDAIHEVSPLTSSTEDNPCGLSTPIPCDDHNHGTHTVGTMTGDDGNGNQIGVAPGAKWIACRNMERGNGSPATYIECFEWFMAPTDMEGLNADPSKAPHVINNSWGCPPVEGCDETNYDVMETAIANIKAAGVVVVVSAGNSGSSCGTVSNPAGMFEPSFTVGAFRSNDTIANFSSRGLVTVDGSMRMKPNVAAPGVGVRSCITGGDYASWNGTSMAGPHVAGLVALMISANPALAGEVDMIEDIIEETAIPMVAEQECGGVPGSAVPNPVYGYGRIDALAAVEAALLFTGVDNVVDKNELLIYPNPFTDQIELSLEQVEEDLKFTLFSAEGKVVLERSFDQQTFVSETIYTGSLAKGVYYFSLVGDKVYESGKLVKVD